MKVTEKTPISEIVQTILKGGDVWGLNKEQQKALQIELRRIKSICIEVLSQLKELQS